MIKRLVGFDRTVKQVFYRVDPSVKKVRARVRDKMPSWGND